MLRDVQRLILATDMTRHSDYIAALQSLLAPDPACRVDSADSAGDPRLPEVEGPPCALDGASPRPSSQHPRQQCERFGALQLGRDDAPATGGSAAGDSEGLQDAGPRHGAQEAGQPPPAVADARSRRMVAELLLKSADTSNVLRPFHVARKWAVSARHPSRRNAVKTSESPP